jgi:O-antigen/teichoic acid export membrane protein
MAETQAATLSTASPLPGASVFAPLLKRLQAMLGWRLLAMVVTAAGNIWASRCLGPKNLGMSAAVQAVYTQALLFTNFGQNNFLIRQFKHTDGAKAQLELVENVVALRAASSFLLAGLAIIVLLVQGVPSIWLLPIGAGIALFILEAQTPDWLLQAQENQTAIYRSSLYGAVLGAACYFLLFRPGVSAGANLLVGCASALVVRVLTYKTALSELGLPRLGLEHIRPALRLLWRGRVFFATAIVISIYTQGEQLIVAYYRPIDELGVYKTALQITGAAMPIVTIITSLLYPRFIEWRKRGANYLWMHQLRLGSIALAGCVLGAFAVFAIIPHVYPLMFGPRFMGGALPCAILLTSRMLVIPVCIFVHAIWAHGKDRVMLAITSVTAVFSLGLNFALIPKHGIIYASVANLASEALMLALGVIISFRLRNADEELAPTVV